MTVTPAGIVTDAPTDSIRPFRNTIVPDSIGALVAVTRRAPRMAYAYGASARGAATSVASAAIGSRWRDRIVTRFLPWVGRRRKVCGIGARAGFSTRNLRHVQA